MEITQSTPNESAAVQERELLAWSVHRVREDPYRLLPVLGSAAFSAIVAWILFRNPLFSAAALFMIASATTEYWIPIRYRLTDRGAYCRYGANRLEIEWQAVKRALLAADGVRLSPLALASRLDAFRGVNLRFAPDGQHGDRESVLSHLKVQRPARSEEAET
jgi:hypothetical protein